MATDAQGRQLSDDGYYYWDGSNWQPVNASDGDASASSQQSQQQQSTSSTASTDAQGRQLSEDGHYFWDGSNWQPVAASGGDGAGGTATATATAKVSAEDVMKGLHVLSTAAELAEIFGTLPEALGAWVEPIGGVLTIVDMVMNTLKALETEERGAGYRGTAYGMVYGALGMGIPSGSCHGSLKGSDQDQLDQKAFDEGAREASGKMSDAVSKNRVIVRIAKDGDPGTTVTNIYQQLCNESDDRELASAYSSLSWPGPVCA